jgi:hypothetical protein
MERVSIKESFGNEVSFTKFIAEDDDTKQRLLESLGYPIDCEYSIDIESKTVDSKRVDLVIKNDDDESINVIESQDSTGWLDTIHSSKISYYCWEKNCNYGTLLTEDASEYIKGYIKWLNENTPLNITILKSLIYKTNHNSYHVDFFPIMRWIDGKEKKIESRKTIITNFSEDDHYKKVNKDILSKFIEFKEECKNKFDMEFTSKKSYISAKINNFNTHIMYCKFTNNKIYLDVHMGIVYESGDKSRNFFDIKNKPNDVNIIEKSWNRTSSLHGGKGYYYRIELNKKTNINSLIDIISEKVESIKST